MSSDVSMLWSWRHRRRPRGGAAGQAALSLSVFPVLSRVFVVLLTSAPLCLLRAHMHRTPLRPQRSPGAPRPAGRFPSPASCWGFPGARSPYAGSPRGYPTYSPGSPVFSPGSNRGFASQRGRGDGFRRPQSFSPTGGPNMPVSAGAGPGLPRWR